MCPPLVDTWGLPRPNQLRGCKPAHSHLLLCRVDNRPSTRIPPPQLLRGISQKQRGPNETLVLIEPYLLNTRLHGKNTSGGGPGAGGWLMRRRSAVIMMVRRVSKHMCTANTHPGWFTRSSTKGYIVSLFQQSFLCNIEWCAVHPAWHNVPTPANQDLL